MKKLTRNLASALIALALPLSFAACSGDDDPVTGVTLDKSEMTLTVGGPNGALTAAAQPTNAANKKLTWTSGDMGKATVAGTDTGATVTPVAAGETVITVKTDDGGFTKTCAVTVFAKVTGVTLDRSTMQLAPGGPAGSLTAEVLPGNASQAVTWVSGDETVATVTGAGATVVINPLATGTATITAASAADPTKTATCTVTVAPVPVAGVTLSLAAMPLAPGAAGGLTATIEPPDATDRAVTWASSNTAAATVSGDGLAATITAAGLGTAVITVRTADGGRTAECAVTVWYDQTSVKMALTTYAGQFFSLAIKDDGSLWTWGYNQWGALGLGDYGSGTNRSVPTRVGEDTDWASVSAGYNHAAALRADGSLWAWGYNEYGQVGNGTTALRQALPVRAGEDSDWAVVSAGGYHTAALKADGSLWTWGWNNMGQLGLGDEGSGTNRSVPTRVGTDNDWAAVSTGQQWVAALKTDGSIWTWGVGQMGSLGIGNNGNRNVPTRVGGDNDWVSIDTGDWHAMAIKADGSLWAWGFNYYGGPESGVLGDGSNTNQNHPVRVVSTDVAWASASATGYHTAGLKADGSVWVWGHNEYGQLGLGDTENRLVPAQAWDTGQWAVVLCSRYSTAALKADGSLWAWGDNQYGQLGDGTTTRQMSPVLVGEGFRLPVR
jgi:alpha-tubulin suppressor-like RCC1 family protein/uncharacterized protein YjdB